MIKLYGFAISNYYNKIKLVLLEKEIEFSEEFLLPSQDESVLNRSPLGKIPFIETEHGNLSESQVILEYLEEQYPQNALYPNDVFERAKCRELIQHLELNLELHARRLYKEVFFGGVVSEETKNEVKERLEIGLKGLPHLTKFSPYIGGDTFSAADCVAWLHFAMISLATQKIYGVDMIAQTFPEIASYVALVESRPHVQKVTTDRAVAMAKFLKK